MGKNIKSYATTQVHFPREREGSLTAKGPNLSFTIWYNLTIHIIRFSNYKQNFQNCLPQEKFQRIMQIPRSSPPQSANSAKFAHFTLCFRHLPRQRTLQNSSELRKFRAVRPHSQRITRNSHILLTYSTPISGTCNSRERSEIPANYANSAQFAHTVRELREICTIC